MPRRKTAKHCKLLPYLSGRSDCRDGRFIQIGNSFLLADAVQNLSGNALKTYLALCMEAGGKLTVAMSCRGAAKYGIQKNTFQRSIQQLTDSGFIVKDFEENSNQYATTVYRFTTAWKP